MTRVSKPRRSASWQRRLVVLLLVFSVAPALTVAALALSAFKARSERGTLSALEGLAAAKTDSIDEFAQTRMRDVERMAQVVSQLMGEVVDASAADPREPPADALPDLEDAERIAVPADPAQPTVGDAPTIEDAPRIEVAPTIEDAPTVRDVPPPESEVGEEPPADEADDPTTSKQNELLQILGLLMGDQTTFEELLIIENSGRVVASTYSGNIDRDAGDLEYFVRGSRATFVQPPFVSPITERLTMVIATPIRDADNRDIGVLAARLNLERFFQLINDNTGLGRTGETVVGRLDGKEILFMAPTRFDPDAALQRRVPDAPPLAAPLRAAVRGERDFGRGLDYRGHDVLAAWSPVERLEWGMVVKMDHEEAIEDLRDVSVTIGLTTTVLLLIAGFVAFAVGRAFIKPLIKLRTAAESLSKGDFDVRIDIESNDEIGQLADSFERLVAAVKFFKESPGEAELEELELEEPEPDQPSTPE